jgi:hypothetical protein
MGVARVIDGEVALGWGFEASGGVRVRMAWIGSG